MAERPLAGLNIVVTRPREQAAGLVQRIEQLGGKPLLFPLLEIESVSDDHALLEQLSRSKQTDLAIFISPNAVRCGMAAMGAAGGGRGGVRFGGVGEGGARGWRGGGRGQ